MVSRTASKDNSSHYEVNGRRCQFKEVAKLLRDKGIALAHKRLLILQGEVEQIALMKPKGIYHNFSLGTGKIAGLQALFLDVFRKNLEKIAMILSKF